MPSDYSLFGDVLTGGTESFAPLPQTRRTAASFATAADLINRQTKWLHEDASGVRRDAQMDALEEHQAHMAAQSGKDLLDRLSDRGFSWTDIARLVGVSIPAVQKWRRGAGITGENRLKLARLAALLEILEKHMIAEPCSWLEMPLSTDVSVSSIDLLVADRYDLVLELARNEIGGEERESILDEFDSDWRRTRRDSNFETVRAADGRLSIQPRD